MSRQPSGDSFPARRKAHLRARRNHMAAPACQDAASADPGRRSGCAMPSSLGPQDPGASRMPSGSGPPSPGQACPSRSSGSARASNLILPLRDPGAAAAGGGAVHARHLCPRRTDRWRLRSRHRREGRGGTASRHGRSQSVPNELSCRWGQLTRDSSAEAEAADTVGTMMTSSARTGDIPSEMVVPGDRGCPLAAGYPG